MSFFNQSFVSPTQSSQSTAQADESFFSFLDCPPTPHSASAFEFEDGNNSLFNSPQPSSPVVKKTKATPTPRKTQGMTPTPRKTSGFGDTSGSETQTPRKKEKVSGTDSISSVGSRPEKISSLIGTSSSKMLFQGDSVPLDPLQDIKTPGDVESSSSVLQSSPPESTIPPPSGSHSLVDIMAEMMEVQQGHLMSSLEALESHHKKGEQLIRRTREISQHVRDYKEKLVRTKARYLFNLYCIKL